MSNDIADGTEFTITQKRVNPPLTKVVYPSGRVEMYDAPMDYVQWVILEEFLKKANPSAFKRYINRVKRISQAIRGK